MASASLYSKPLLHDLISLHPYIPLRPSSFPRFFLFARFPAISVPFSSSLRTRAAKVLENTPKRESSYEKGTGFSCTSFRSLAKEKKAGYSRRNGGAKGSKETFFLGYTSWKSEKEGENGKLNKAANLEKKLGYPLINGGSKGNKEMLHHELGQEQGDGKRNKAMDLDKWLRYLPKNEIYKGNKEMILPGFTSLKSGREGGNVKAKKAVDLDKTVKKEKKDYKRKVTSEEVKLRIGLDMCSKAGDVMGALSLYDDAVRKDLKLQQYHYNVLLYLCSSAATGFVYPAKSGSSGNCGCSSDQDTSVHESTMQNLGKQRDFESCMMPTFQLIARHSEDSKPVTPLVQDECRQRTNGSVREINGVNDKNAGGVPIRLSDDLRAYARRRGFEIYDKMCLVKVGMSEAAMTSVARMAMSIGDGDMAFEIVKQMKARGIKPRLRSYGPAILSFCHSGSVDKAFEVERHMQESGITPEEPELEALLRASVQARRGEKVYYLLHKLRTSVRQVSSSAAYVIEEWFKSSTASRVGKRKWDRKNIEQPVENGGGGWHGLGWLGKGKWTVVRTHVNDEGVCLSCGDKLVTIDLDPVETENFAKSVASIANKRERNSSFEKFQKWLDYYGPFEAIIDAANVGLLNHRQLSITKVNAVSNGIRQKLPSKKWPLIIVHNKRLFGGKMNEPFNKKLVEKWKNADAIYATPTGSNDDWYWLYAAIKCKCLVVTNDEMRDHVFQVLGNDFFPRWKERHQVHFSYQDGSFQFQMPPPCSVVIQESDRGHWHIPITEHRQGTDRTWMCMTRASSHMTEASSTLLRETLDDTTSKVTDLNAQAAKPSRSLYDDGHPKGSHSPPKHPHKKILKKDAKTFTAANQFSMSRIISAIENAEKTAGCVVDFQI